MKQNKNYLDFVPSIKESLEWKELESGMIQIKMENALSLISLPRNFSEDQGSVTSILKSSDLLSGNRLTGKVQFLK